MENKHFKKFLPFLTVLFVVATIFSLRTFAADDAYVKTGTCGKEAVWTLNIKDRTLTISGSGDMENCKYGASPWINYNSYIEKVVIEEGITSVGAYSFYCLDAALKSVRLPETLTKIGAHAFYSCKLLESVNLPNSVETIGAYAFSFCLNLPSVTLPESLRTVEDDTFYCCQKLGTVVVPESVSAIKDQAFASGQTEIKIEFLGDMPAFENVPFRKSSVKIYYPCGNSTWDPVFFSNFGGSVTWNIRHINNDCSNFIADIKAGTITGTCKNCNSEYTMTVDTIACVNSEFRIGVRTNKWQTFDIMCTDGCKVNSRYSGYSGVFVNDSFSGTIYMRASVKSPGLHRLKVSGSASGNDLYYNVFIIEHRYSKETVKPTCTENGADYYTCSLCSYKYKDNVTDALGHKLGNYISDGNATCTKDATETAHCNRCDYSETRTVSGSALGHSSVIDSAVAATCEKPGKTAGSHCSFCGFVTEPQKEIAALGHKVVCDKAIAATCTKSGKTSGSHCSICGKVLSAQKIVAKKAHIYKTSITKADAAKKKNGKSVSVCSFCKTQKIEKIYCPKAMSLSYTKATYTGKSLKPKVIIKDANGTIIPSSNYDITYSNNKKVGTATVTVKFKGKKYKGVLKKTFVINPPGTWTNGWSTDSKSFTVMWEKQSKQTTGYIVEYSTSSKFKKNKTKTVKIKDSSKTYLDVKNCKRNTTYYVRVRTYKVVGDKTYYSDWQSASHGKEPPLKLKTEKR